MKKYLFVILGIVLVFMFTGCSKQKTIRYPQEGLKEEWDVTGCAIDTAVAGINIKTDLAMGADNGSVPICYSEKYDVIYYVNYSDNNFIYRCKDNETKLAVKIPTRHLYMKDEELYFRVMGGDYELKGMNEGDIYKYSPITGKIEKVIKDAASTWMMVLKNNIYYENEEGLFCYDLETDVSEKVTAYSYPCLALWNEDYSIVAYCPGMVEGSGSGITGLGLHKLGTDCSMVEPIILEGRNNIYCVQGNTLYCTGTKIFYEIQLDTGEIRKFDYPTSNSRSMGLGDFTIQNDKVYQQNLSYFIDLTTGESYKLYGESKGYISRLFNINDRIFAIYYEKGSSSGMPIGIGEIVEVVVDEEPSLRQEGDFIFGEVIYYNLKKIGE